MIDGASPYPQDRGLFDTWNASPTGVERRDAQGDLADRDLGPSIIMGRDHLPAGRKGPLDTHHVQTSHRAQKQACQSRSASDAVGGPSRSTLFAQPFEKFSPRAAISRINRER